MTEEILDKLHKLNGESDIDMLNYLKTVCNEEDKKAVDRLIDMNHHLFDDNEKNFSFAEEKEYFLLKFKVLSKYDEPSTWEYD